MKKIKLKSTKGITLIALVITIIVLLILAGVSIATLTGENGILTQAEDAKTKTERAEVIERAKTDVFGIQAGNEGKISETDLESILKKYDKDGQVRKNDKGESYIITDKGQEIKVTEVYTGKLEQGEFVFNPEELTIGTATNTDKYGWKVKDYTVKTTDCPSGVWRLFYQDSNYTYLINDELTATTYLPSNYYTSYVNGAAVSTVGQKLSPKISSLFTESNTNSNIRFTAWMTDPEAWKDYKDKNGDAVFAIGSPTAELFEASYNNTGKANTINLALGTYGYTENTGSKWLKAEDNKGIYNKDDSSHWWLASPGGNSSRGLSMDGGNGYFYGRNVDIGSYAVRPLVCIPTSVFNSDYLDSVVNE